MLAELGDWNFTIISSNLNNEMNFTNSTTRKKIHFFETQFDHVQTQLTFAFWFFIITIAKIVFHRLEKFHILPDSALLLLLGCIFGGILHFLLPDQEVYLQPSWFFLYLLPPIALDAGYFLPNKDFFQNIGTITVFAIFGTLWNIASIGGTLICFSKWFNGQPSTIDILLFATIISAVDPVAVICVFEQIHVNSLLFILVFGESMCNDAVSIVLYHTLHAIAEVGTNNVVFTDYLLAILAFVWVSIGGIIIGIIWAILTGLCTKSATKVGVVQPLTCLLFPYLAYLIAESLGLSGILAIVVCGLLMKQYVIGNITEKSLVTINYFMKTLSSSCEAMIFVFLGISAVSRYHDIDYYFVGITLITCFIYRFIGVIVLTYLVNLKRMQKISFVDQFIMGYGGIRGAVCYGLVMSLDPNLVKSRSMFATTTIIVILFTVFVQGGTIKRLVTYLKVKQQDDHKKRVFDMIADNFINHLTGSIEAITGLHGEYWLRMRIEQFNDTYIKPYIMNTQEKKIMKIVKKHEEIQVLEAVNYLKQHGSFAGMPTVQSRIELCGNGEEKRFSLNTPGLNNLLNIKSNNDTIPRNQSISVFVRDKFAEINSPLQRYSRHYLEGDFNKNIHSILFNNNEEDYLKEEYEVNDACYKTFPYSKSSQRDLLISNIRKASRTNNNNNGNNNNTNIHSSISPTAENKRPKFVITSDDIEPELGIIPNHSTSTEPNNTYSIGRFEIESEHNNHLLASRKFSHHLNVNNHEEMINLMPIDEQDETEQQTITSI